MASELQDDDISILVKNKLNNERTKLWLPPYSDEEGNREKFTDELVKRYAEELQLDIQRVDKAVEGLRVSSIERMSARNSFLVTGVAALKVKLAVSKSEESRGHKEPFIVNTKLDVRGFQLRNLIAERCEVNVGDVKMISSGRVLNDDQTLTEQGLSVTSVILAIVLPKSICDDSPEIQARQAVQKTRNDAEIVACHSGLNSSDGQLMEIADQKGRPLKIPKHEQQALSLAMILNEKGKAALRNKNYTEALLLLLEADKEFSKCSAEILNCVDNYGLLCLDITWCYLCLKSIEDLPDAETRLKTCETCFQKSYGINLERVQAVKGTTGNECALLVRLSLLKGIAAFYRKQWKLAESLFSKVEKEIQNLKVDDEKLCEIISMGYSPAEARVGLRSSYGNLEMAVSYIINKREEKKKILKEEEEKRKDRLEAKKYGKTANGELMNMNFYKALVSMGFAPNEASRALRHASNNMSLAVQIIQDHPELLMTADNNANTSEEFSDEMLAKVISCGFEPEAARMCLGKHKGNAEAAIDELVSTGGIFLKDVDNTSAKEYNDYEEDMEDRDLKAGEALARLRADIPEDEDAYLDITLNDESAFLVEYKLLLSHILK